MYSIDAKPNHNEIDKPQIRDIMQNSWLILFKSVKIKKDNLRNSSRLKT